MRAFFGSMSLLMTSFVAETVIALAAAADDWAQWRAVIGKEIYARIRKDR